MLLPAVWACAPSGGESGKIRLAATVQGEVQPAPADVLQVVPEIRRTVGVVGFANQTADPALDWLSRGLSDLMVENLGRSRTIAVVPPARLDAILAAVGKRRDDLTADRRAMAVVARAEIETLLVGRYFRDGDRLVIASDLVDVRGAEPPQEHRVEVESGLGDLFQVASNLSGAVRTWLAADEAPPVADGELTDSVEALRSYSIGQDYRDKLLLTEAATAYETATEVDPEFASAYLRLVEVRQALGDPRGSRAALDLARRYEARLRPTDHLRLRMMIARHDGDVVAIRAARTELRRHQPRDIDARLEVANLLFGLADDDRARVEYERVLEEDPGRALAYNQLAYLHAQRGDTQTAIRYLDDYRRLAPDEPNVYDTTGEVLMWAGRLREASAQFGLALARWPSFLASAEHQVEVCSELGEVERAVAAAQHWIDIAPSADLRALGNLAMAEVLWRYGRVGEARSAIDRARAISPKLVVVDWVGSRLPSGPGAGTVSGTTADWFERHRGILDREPWDGVAASQFLSLAMRGGVEPAILLAAVETAREREPIGRERNTYDGYRAVLLVRAGRFDEGRLSFAGGAVDHLSNLLGRRELRRTDGWEYLVEAIQRLPTTVPPDRTIATRVGEFARESERSELMVLARLLEVQYDDKYGDAAGVERGYRQLGMAPESTWRVVGPFENRAGFNRPFPPEEKLDFAAVYPCDGRDTGWQPAIDPIADGFIDLAAILGRSEWAVGYAAIDLVAPSERVVQIRVGHDEAMKLWVNGQLVAQSYRSGELGIDGTIVKVVLHAGPNRLLVKVTNTLDDWGFYLRVTDEDGTGHEDLAFRAPLAASQPQR